MSIDDEITQDDDTKTWSFTCPLLGCGTFTSRDHPTKQSAVDRRKAHREEHGQADDADTDAEETG